MTDQEINKAIAEAVGWKPTFDAGICWNNEGNAIVSPPNYCNNLNEMHEVEKKLSINERRSYATRLNTLYGEQGQVFVTAKQKAVVFLETLNLWK